MKRIQRIGRGRIIVDAASPGRHYGPKPSPGAFGIRLSKGLISTDVEGESVGTRSIPGFDDLVTYNDIAAAPDPDEHLLHEERWLRPTLGRRP